MLALSFQELGLGCGGVLRRKRGQNGCGDGLLGSGRSRGEGHVGARGPYGCEWSSDPCGSAKRRTCLEIDAEGSSDSMKRLDIWKRLCYKLVFRGFVETMETD